MELLVVNKVLQNRTDKSMGYYHVPVRSVLSIFPRCRSPPRFDSSANQPTNRNGGTTMSKDKKQRYLYIDGQAVPVTEEVYRAYSLHWNMWYASHKPPHSHSDKL